MSKSMQETNRENFSSSLSRSFEDGKAFLRNGAAEETVAKAARDAGKKAGEIASQVSDSMSETYEAGRRYVEENPIRSIAVVAAAGFIAGSFLTLAFRQK